MTGSGAVQVPTAGGNDVLVEQRGRVLLVTINRPDAREGMRAFAEKRSPRWQGQ